MRRKIRRVARQKAQHYGEGTLGERRGIEQLLHEQDAVRLNVVACRHEVVVVGRVLLENADARLVGRCLAYLVDGPLERHASEPMCIVYVCKHTQT